MKPETQKKLTYLHETKQLIKEALISKGQNVSETDTFRSYVDHILAISGGGTGEVETDILPKATISGFALDSTYQAYTPGPIWPSTFALTAGETYIVDWDGETYTCEAGTVTHSGENVVYIGNGAYLGQSGNDEPFVITYVPSENGAQLFSDSDADSHTVRIYQKSSTGATIEGAHTVTFCDYEGTELFSRPVFDGDDCPEPATQGRIETPARESTAQYEYTFNGWSLTAGVDASVDALAAVVAERTVYAAYEAKTRYYTVNFWNGETLFNTQLVAYGSKAAVPDTVIEGYYFEGWDKDPTTLTIVENTDFYGTWIIDEGWLAYRGTLTELDGEENTYVYDIRYTPDGTRMVAATDCNLYLYDATTTPYTLLVEYSTGTSRLQTGIDISPDGTELALCYKNKSTSVNNSLKFFSLADDTLTYKSSASGTLGTSSVLYAPRYSHDGTKVAVWANESKGVAVFERSGSWTLAADIATTNNIYLYNDIYRIDLAFSPDDTVLSAVCGYSYQYVAHSLFDMTSYTDITGTKSVGYTACKYRTAFHPSGDYLLIGGEKTSMGATTYNAINKITLSGEGAANERTYSSTTFSPTAGATSDIAGMEFGPTGKVILLTHLGTTPTLHGYLTDTWEELEAPSTLPDGYGRSLAVSPDGKVAVGTEGGKVFTYKLRE